MITLTQFNIIPLISLILYVIISFIILSSEQTKLSKSFLWYVFAMILWSLGSFLMKTDMPPSSLFWNRILLIGLILVPIFLLRFSYTFAKTRVNKLIEIFAIVITIVLLILGMTGNIVETAQYVNGEFIYKITYGAYIFVVYGILYSIISLWLLLERIVKYDKSFKRNGLIVIGLFFVLLGGASNINTSFGKYGIDILLNTINAILITYAIYHNKFLEINLVVKKSISVVVYHVFSFIIYAGSIYYAYYVIKIIFKIENTFSVIILMIPVFIIMEQIRLYIQKLTQQLFYSSRLDRQRELNQFSRLINYNLDLEKITNELITSTQNALKPKDLTLLLKNGKGFLFNESSTTDTTNLTSFFSFEHPIILWLETHDYLLRTTLENDIAFKSLWDKEKEVLKALGNEVIMPIKNNDELIGILIMSERLDETPYSYEEIEFLGTLLNNASAILQNAKTMKKIKQAVITDELTGFFNHRHLYDQVNTWLKTNKYARFSLVMIDFDQFNIYNDLYGYSSGDKALKKLAELIRNNTTDREFLTRFGGEEFVIIYPMKDGINTYSEAEEIREKVQEEFLRSPDIKEFLTVSLGISEYPLNGQTLDDIISKADIATSRSKKRGRNKTTLYKADYDFSDDSIENNERIKEALVSSTYALAATIDAKDHYTYGHSNNVSMISVAIAQKIGCSNKEIDIVRSAGLLHDVGKIALPERILKKQGYLTDEEYDITKKHVVQSINIIKHVKNLVDTIPAIMSHHERWDGKGYPRGLKENNIPILGRIIAIADSFDAMTTDRPYRKGLSLEQAIWELKKNAGRQFDPDLVETTVKLITDSTLSNLDLKNRLSY
ncbi:MAG: diguanylate cyclase [Candidatus Izimaplasma sp.]|nr:diguanylate cyclase [Candidatus Izimaplasma bacterium]